MLAYGLILLAYLLGSLPFGVWIAAGRGVDILSVGSGNPGATNVWRAVGKSWGALVFLLDVAKGLAPAVLGRFLLHSQEWAFALGLVAVIGHTLSPFLRFRGGKGVSTALGAVLGSSPFVALTSAAVFFAVVGLSKYVSLGSLCGAAMMVVAGFALDDPPLLKGGYIALAIYLVIKHRDNIGRLRKGTERKIA